MTDPIQNANALNDADIAANGKGQITAPILHTVLAAIIGASSAIGGVALTGSLGSNALPATGNAAICLTSGESVTLPPGAIPNTVISASDCTQGTQGTLLATPDVVNASTDATIAGASSYSLTIAGQGVSFRKTAAGPWQPF